MVTVYVEEGTTKEENAKNLEQAIRRFRKAVEKEGVLDEYHKRQYFTKPSAVKHQKKVLIQHQIKLQKKEEEFLANNKYAEEKLKKKRGYNNYSNNKE